MSYIAEREGVRGNAKAACDCSRLLQLASPINPYASPGQLQICGGLITQVATWLLRYDKMALGLPHSIM